MRLARLAAASAALTVAVGALTASTSFAAPTPKFVKGPTYTQNGNALTAAGHAVGMGGQRVTVTLVAHADYGCMNPAGHIVPGLHGTASGSADYPAAHNGSVNFSVTTGSLETNCPGPMTVVNVDFTDATLTISDSSGITILSNTTTNI
jgi:hypothetical protein